MALMREWMGLRIENVIFQGDEITIREQQVEILEGLSHRDFISLEDHVFNTEAHPFPRFKPSGDLKTGWERDLRVSAIQ
jgi:hypothetical protein